MKLRQERRNKKKKTGKRGPGGKGKKKKKERNARTWNRTKTSRIPMARSTPLLYQGMRPSLTWRAYHYTTQAFVCWEIGFLLAPIWARQTQSIPMLRRQEGQLSYPTQVGTVSYIAAQVPTKVGRLVLNIVSCISSRGCKRRIYLYIYGNKARHDRPPVSIYDVDKTVSGGENVFHSRQPTPALDGGAWGKGGAEDKQVGRQKELLFFWSTI